MLYKKIKRSEKLKMCFLFFITNQDNLVENNHFSLETIFQKTLTYLLNFWYNNSIFIFYKILDRIYKMYKLKRPTLLV